jgi:hypothetical protein
MQPFCSAAALDREIRIQHGDQIIVGCDPRGHKPKAWFTINAGLAYQEWMSARVELNSKEWQKAVEHGQKLIDACTRINGSERVGSK